jgi:hypothetical protein
VSAVVITPTTGIPELAKATDRKLYRHAVSASKDYDSYGCTGLYTVNYRVKTKMKTFFLEGNEYMQQLYNGNFPWRAK